MLFADAEPARALRSVQGNLATKKPENSRMQTIASIIKSYNAIIASPRATTDSPGATSHGDGPIRRPTAAISVHLHTKRSPAGRRASCGLSLRSQRHSSIGPERYTHRKGLLSYRPFGPFESTTDEPRRGLLTCQSFKFTHVTARPLSSCPHLLNCHLQSPFVLAGRLYVSCFVAKVCSNRAKSTNRPRPCDN